jgi:hypothetical protein
MKIKWGYSCVFVFCLLACGFAPVDNSIQPVVTREIGETLNVVNVGLADIDEVCVRIVPVQLVGFNWKEVEDQISRRLGQSGLKVLTGDISELNDKEKELLQHASKSSEQPAKNLKWYSSKKPEMIVRISVLQGTESGPCVYHVQTSFAREVYLRSSRSSMKAEVWRIDVPVGIADANGCDSAIAASAVGQVDAFIADWKKANTVKTSADIGEQKIDVNEPVTLQQDVQAGQQNDYEYVASKNSKVFHKKDCRAAARISPENLIGFKTRDEAIQSGRRPCKICNP